MRPISAVKLVDTMLLIATKVESGSLGQDRVVVERLADRSVIVVADGAGGVAGGAQAAQTVCDLIVAHVHTSSPPGSWVDELRAIDLHIATLGAGGLSTAVVLEIREGKIVGASVGDSGAWMVSKTEVIDLTQHQVRKPLLGSGAAIPVGFGPIPLSGRLLIGTDGLFKYASRENIIAGARKGTVDEAIPALVDAVRLRNGKLQDDIAVVLCEEI